MKVLLACEESQIVAEQFALRGHDVMSCDIEFPGALGLPHYFGDIADILYDGWDLMIGFPPCTRLTNSVIWYIKQNNLYHEVETAAKFFNLLLNAPIEKIAMENPIQHGEARKYIRKYNQTIQPYNFGDDASKATCIWLKNLPPLENTEYIQPRIVNGKKRWSNQTDGGWNKLPPSADRGKLRSKAFPGISKAMAEQWG